MNFFRLFGGHLAILRFEIPEKTDQKFYFHVKMVVSYWDFHAEDVQLPINFIPFKVLKIRGQNKSKI